MDFTLVTRRRVRLLARDRQHDDLRPPCSLSRASHSSDPPTPLSVQPSHSGPITLRVMGMAGSWSDGPQDLGAPSSRVGRPGAARPSQPVDAAHRLAHPCCGSCSGQPEHAGTVGCASTPRPFLPHTPSFPDSSRRPSACRSEWGLGIRWQELRLSAYPCRRSGFERRSPAPCSCRPRYPARDGWGLRRLQPPPSGCRNKVPRGGGDRGSAALTAFGTTTAASERGAG